MVRPSRLAILAAMIVAAACSPDSTPPLPRSSAKAPASRSSTTTPSEATPVSMTIFPNEIVADGTNSTTARVNVDSAVACCDRTIEVAFSDTTLLQFFSLSSTVSAGASFAAIQIDPKAVSQRTVLTVYATGNGVTVSSDVILDPPGTTIPPTLSSFTVNPGTVNAGQSAVGTVTIPSPAPASGVLVNLGSRVPSSASVPPSITVPAGATSASFTITTFTGFPNSTTCPRLDAYTSTDILETQICVVTGGTADTSTSTSPSPSLVAPTLTAPSADQRFTAGSTVAFDWSDVAGAASYELQIDDTDKFSAPLVLDRTVTASQFSAGGLPTETMFWRVRAISSTGATGPWSAVQRFELK